MFTEGIIMFTGTPLQKSLFCQKVLKDKIDLEISLQRRAQFFFKTSSILSPSHTAPFTPYRHTACVCNTGGGGVK